MSRKIIEGLAQAVNLKGSVWHFMDPETVAGYGPWVRKEDHDAALAEKDAEIERLREALADLEDEIDNSAIEFERPTFVEVCEGIIRAALMPKP